MPEVPVYVVDSSLVAKWRLKDESLRPQALAVQRDYENGRISLLAPDHFRYEVVSAFRKAVIRHRLTVEQGREAMDDFLAWRIPIVDGGALIPAAYEYCFRFSCTLYDGLYLALAQVANRRLIYADDRLRSAIGDRFPLALWMEEYQSPT